MKDAFTSDKDPKEKIHLNLSENDFVVKHRDDDPYGFWWIGREKGQVPEELRGAYTTSELAKNAVQEYIAQK